MSHASGQQAEQTLTNARTPMFASLKLRNYSLFFWGGLVSNVGTWMARIAQTWLVLTILTDHSASAVGYVTGLQFLPMLLFGPWGGAVADRFPKRIILVWTQVLLAVNAGALALLVLGNVVELWHVYVLAFLQGMVTAVDNPARQAFASEMVPPSLLPNAVGLNSTSFNGARLVGPAVAGLLIAVAGVGPSLLINAFTFLPVIAALLAMDPTQLTPAPIRRGRGSVREGLRYVAGRPDLQLTMFIVFMLGTFGMNFQITNALMATEVFGAGADAYGVLGSIMAVGSLTAALMAARRPRPRLSIMLGALLGFAIATFALALAPTYEAFAILLIPVGLTALTVMTTANASVQLSTEPIMRGRVMALYMMIFLGGTPIGAPMIGWIGDAWGARWTVLIGAIATAAAFVVGMFFALRRNDWHIPSWRELRGVPEPTPVDPEEG